MSEFRIDLVSGNWVLISGERFARPRDFVEIEPLSLTHVDTTSVAPVFGCPFCYEHEYMTPEAVFTAYEENKQNHWNVRVFENKYPAVSESNIGVSSNYNSLSGYGRHEILIDTPRHYESTHHFSAEKMFEVLNAIKNRINYMKKDKLIKHTQVFKNVGRAAGATKEHSHWQLISLPVVLPTQSIVVERSKNFYHEHNECIFCHDLSVELSEGTRVIETNELFALYCPYASKFTYEMRIMPKIHAPFFEDIDEHQMQLLSKILVSALHRLYLLDGSMAYNICLMNSPYINLEEFRCLSHWYIQIIPRLGNWAGFEFATGCYSSVVLPETAALKLSTCI